ncbi:MAG: pilin [Patescibacteria group bacterium]|nr:pilin [Patescibacteria group bacterium]
MSKNLIKLSSLFCGIFAVLFILFFSTSVFAQFPPTTPTPTFFTHTCFCFDPNPTPGNISFRQEDLPTANPNAEQFCTDYCTEKKWEFIGYQKSDEDAVILEEKYKQLYLQQLPEEPETDTKADFSDCFCSDGNSYPVDDCKDNISSKCTALCTDSGSTFESCDEASAQTQQSTDQTGTSQTAPGCECTNGFKDSSITDSAGCTAKCEGKGGVKSFTPPQKKDTQIPGTSISNPISVSTPAELIKKIINYVLGIVGAVAVLIIIYSGFVYMTSRGNEKQIESAKNSLTYAIIGLVVIFASIIIVNAVISAIGG